MSPVCHNFVQNAWKKDFCSNCFKSRDEHAKQDKSTTDSGKYFATPYHNRSTFFKSKPPTSILKIHPKKKSKRSVKFPEEVSSVIGYGGDDWPDDEEFQISEDVDDDDTFPETEEEKELQKLTKSNTDFNTVKENLLGALTGEARKSYTSLLLGKIQTDSEGKKKTLMVSVTPFGQDNSKNTKIKSHSRKPAVVPMSNCSTENTTSGYKTNIILSTFVKDNDTVISTKYEKKETTTGTSSSEKSLLEEISETLEQNRISAVSELNLSQSEAKKPTVVDEKIKDEITNENSEKKDTSESKKNGLVRNSPIIKSQERPKVNLSRPEFKFCKINIENNSVDSAVSTLSSNTTNTSFTSDDDSFSGRTDSDNDDSGTFAENTKPKEDSHKIKIFNKMERSVDTTDHAEDIRKVDGQSDSFAQTYQTKILNMPPIIPKMSTELFSVEASRESAGEPDGRADPDEPSEAPALPNSPVPTNVDPRPSFLHGMISDIQMNRPIIPEKPKLPVKPMSVMKQSTSKRTSNTVPQQQQVIMQLQQTLNTYVKEDHTNEGKDLTEELNNEITEIKDDSPDTMYFNNRILTKQDSDSSINLTFNKRKAPMPPPSPSSEENIGAKYQRNPFANMKSDSPVVREKEKRERATSISPKMKPGDNSPSMDESKNYIPDNEIVPEPAPRRNISLSHDNLLIDDKRKGKLKFSIKKLLRIGSSKDLDKKDLSTAIVSKLSLKTEEIYDLAPKPKPRLVIIHPLELNGSSVEVLKTNSDITENSRRLSHDSESIYSGTSSMSDMEPTPPKVVNKPPPPPRTFSEEGKSSGSTVKPARPPPPKSAALQKKQKQQTWATTPPPNRADTNIYANLGEVRSAIAPRKPERTASMREREAQLELPKRRTPLSDEKDDDEVSQGDIVEATNEEVIHNYDDVYNSVKYDNDSCIEDNAFDSAKNSDSDYEYVNHARSSSPECDSGIKKTEETAENRLNFKDNFRKNEAEPSTDYVKYSNGTFNRSSSLPYCGSETESEIYSPYSFYSSTDMDGSACNDDYGNEMSSKNTTSKLRVRKGRSVVHKNLEDNYGAVVIANHEALAQVLEQVQQSAMMQPSLRGLKACTNLRWSDFTLTQTQTLSSNKSTVVKSGKRLFCPAVWNSSSLGAVNVMLMLHKEQMASQIVSQQSVQPQTLSLNAVTEFCDLVPLQQFGEESDDLVQATIVVLAHTQVDTIQSYGRTLHASENLNTKDYQLIQSEQAHEATFVMLQLINGLKCLQARGIEEIPDTLTSFIIIREHYQSNNLQGSTVNLQASEDRLSSISAPKTNNYGRLCILQGLSEDINCNKSSEDEHLSSLCECAISALEILLPEDKLTPLIKELLQNERAVSLSQAKAVLEFTLWGPLDVVQGVPVRERELSLQRWLDLERATVLHGLVRTRVHLNAFEQLHLVFLVRSSAKAMCDASVLLEKANVY